MGSQDGLVALGGILQAATDAYKTSVQEQADSHKRLHAELEDKVKEEANVQKKRCVELEEKIQKLSAEFESFKASVQGQALLKFSLLDIAGVWFEEKSKSRVRVTEGGKCFFDGQERTASVDGSNIKLNSGFVLSMQKSSRKRLVWENGQESFEWLYEMPGGSRRVTLCLDLGAVLREMRYGREEETYIYNFSLIGCEVKLLFERTTKDPGNVGAFFGLRKSTSRIGESTNNVDAITCRAQVDLWNPKEKKWLNLFRNRIIRYEAEKTAWGETAAITVARLKEILTSTEGYGYARVQNAQVRVTITDIGLLELSKEGVIRPS